jgi:anti-repressor protein
MDDVELAEILQALQNEICAVREEIQAIRKTVAFHDLKNWRDAVNQILNNIGERSGNYETIRTISYKMLEQRAHCDLSIRLKFMRRRARQSGLTKTETEAMNYLDIIAADIRLREIYIGIVKELAIKHKVA